MNPSIPYPSFNSRHSTGFTSSSDSNDSGDDLAFFMNNGSSSSSDTDSQSDTDSTSFKYTSGLSLDDRLLSGFKDPLSIYNMHTFVPCKMSPEALILWIQHALRSGYYSHNHISGALSRRLSYSSQEQLGVLLPRSQRFLQRRMELTRKQMSPDKTGSMLEERTCRVFLFGAVLAVFYAVQIVELYKSLTSLAFKFYSAWYG